MRNSGPLMARFGLRGIVTLLTAWVAYYGHPSRALATYMETITASMNANAPSCGPWTGPFVDGLTIGARIGPVAVGTPFWPTGGLFERTCVVVKVDKTTLYCYPSAWDLFWCNTGAPGTTKTCMFGPPHNELLHETKFFCNPPAGNGGVSPPKFDDFIETHPDDSGLMTILGHTLMLDSTKLPNNSLDAYFLDLSARYANASTFLTQFATTASVDLAGANPNAPALVSTLFNLAGDFSSLSLAYQSPSASFPQNAYDPLLQDTQQLRSLVPAGFTSTNTLLSGLQKQIDHLTTMSSLLQGGIDSTEVADFLTAEVDYTNTDFRELGYSITLTKTPEPSSLTLLGLGSLGLLGYIRRSRKRAA